MNVHEGLRERLVERVAGILYRCARHTYAFFPTKDATSVIDSLALTELIDAADAAVSTFAPVGDCVCGPRLGPCVAHATIDRYRTARAKMLGEQE